MSLLHWLAFIAATGFSAVGGWFLGYYVIGPWLWNVFHK